MQTNVRELKSHLSEYLRRAAEGEDVAVSVHGRVVAKIVAVPAEKSLESLVGEPGISWGGGKPAGLKRPEVLAGDVSLSDWVSEDRR